MHTTVPYDFVLLIPCFNNIEGLMKSLDSVQYNGSYKILVVDDGSYPKVEKKLPASYRIKHPMQIIGLTQNQGIALALNEGLRYIQQHCLTKYIARLDCGDICHPLRFEKQINFLNNNPTIGLLGSWCIFKNFETGSVYNYTTPISHKDILREMHFRNVFIHPTVVFRNEILKENIFYPTKYKYAEDYALFWSILQAYQGAIIDEFLVNCELKSTSISALGRKKQLKERKLIVQHFASHKSLKILGLMRLFLLSVVPSSIILKLKKIA